MAAQGICVLAILVIGAAGCARVPTAGSGAVARAHLLHVYASEEPGSRGVGLLSVRRGAKRHGTLDVRWASVAESVVVVGYVGPVRALDASLLGDSVYVGLRPFDLGLAGPVPPGEGMGARGLRFLARPWDFSAPWVRVAIERAAVEPVPEGWRLTGTLEPGVEANPYLLDLDAKGDPRRLRIGRAGGEGALVTVRYGPARSYRGGRLPRWIEWERGPSLVRLTIDEYARAKPARLRHAPPADPEWTLLTLDDPRSRDLLRRLLGVGEEGREP